MVIITIELGIRITHAGHSIAFLVFALCDLVTLTQNHTTCRILLSTLELHYKLACLTYNELTTGQSGYLRSLIN